MAGSLCDLMAITDRVLSEEHVAAVLRMCLQGLTYFHALGHLHRDVKAGNILLNENGCKWNELSRLPIALAFRSACAHQLFRFLPLLSVLSDQTR